mgnify:FL=1
MNLHNKVTQYYENIEFNVTTGTTNYDVASNQTTFLSNFGVNNVEGRMPSRLYIRTNNTISVKLNATTNHAITITSTDSPFQIEGVEYTNVYITNNSGSTAAVKLLVTNLPY